MQEALCVFHFSFIFYYVLLSIVFSLFPSGQTMSGACWSRIDKDFLLLSFHLPAQSFRLSRNGETISSARLLRAAVESVLTLAAWNGHRVLAGALSVYLKLKEKKQNLKRERENRRKTAELVAVVAAPRRKSRGGHWAGRGGLEEIKYVEGRKKYITSGCSETEAMPGRKRGNTEGQDLAQ